MGLGQEMYKMSLEHLVSHRGETIKDKVTSKGLRNQPEEAPTALKGHNLASIRRPTNQIKRNKRSQPLDNIVSIENTEKSTKNKPPNNSWN